MNSIWLTAIVFLVGVLIVLAITGPSRGPTIKQQGGSNQRVRTVVKDQSTAQFNYLRNVFDAKQKSLTLLLKINFREEPKSGDFVARLSRDQLLDRNTVDSQAKSRSGLYIGVDCAKSGGCGLAVRFEPDGDPVVIRSLERITVGTDIYLVIVLDGRQWRVYDGNTLPIKGTADFVVGPDLMTGPHTEQQEDGLVKTSRQIPTRSATFSLLYVDGTFNNDYVRDYYDQLREAMDGSTEFIPSPDPKRGHAAPFGPPAAFKKPAQIDAFRGQADIASESSNEPEVTRGTDGVPVVELPASIPVGSDLLQQMKILVSGHKCQKMRPIRNCFKPRSKFTVALLLKTNTWPLENNYLYSILGGDLNETANPCVTLNIDNPGITVKSMGATVENVCNFYHRVEPNKYYLYLLIYNYNRLSIVFNRQAVKYCTNYRQERFESPRNLYVGPNTMSSSQGSDVEVSVGYFPFALPEQRAIRHYNAIQQALIQSSENGTPNAASLALTSDPSGRNGKHPKPGKQSKQAKQLGRPVKNTELAAPAGLQQVTDSPSNLPVKTVERGGLFKDHDPEDFEFVPDTPIRDTRYFKSD